MRASETNGGQYQSLKMRRVMGETLETRLARESPGLTPESPAWGMPRDEYVDMA